jgi:hypothetical protein
MRLWIQERHKRPQKEKILNIHVVKSSDLEITPRDAEVYEKCISPKKSEF